MERVVVVFMEEDASLAAAQSGQVDVAYTSATFAAQPAGGLRPAELRVGGLARHLAARPSPAGGTKKPTRGGEYAAGNDVTCDLAVRQAINYGVDRERMIDNVLNGYGTVAYSVGDGMPWSSPDMKCTTDVERAKKLLDDARLGARRGRHPREGRRARLAGPVLLGRRLRAPGHRRRVRQPDEGARHRGEHQRARAGTTSTRTSSPIRWCGAGAPTPRSRRTTCSTPRARATTPATRTPPVDGYLDEALASRNVEDSFDLWKKAQWDGTTGVAPQGDAPWVWFANVDHLYFAKENLKVAEQKPHPHGHGWSLVNNVDQWSVGVRFRPPRQPEPPDAREAPMQPVLRSLARLPLERVNSRSPRNTGDSGAPVAPYRLRGILSGQVRLIGIAHVLISSSRNIVKFVLLMLAVSMVTFVLVSVSPIDPVQANVGQAAYVNMSEAKRAQLAEYWGVNTPSVGALRQLDSATLRRATWARRCATTRRWPTSSPPARSTRSRSWPRPGWSSGVLGFALGILAGANRGRPRRPHREGLLLPAGLGAHVLAGARVPHRVLGVARVVPVRVLGAHRGVGGRRDAGRRAAPPGAAGAHALGGGGGEHRAAHAREDHRRAGERLRALRPCARPVHVGRAAPSRAAQPRAAGAHAAVRVHLGDLRRVGARGAGVLVSGPRTGGRHGGPRRRRGAARGHRRAVGGVRVRRQPHCERAVRRGGSAHAAREAKAHA